MLAFLNLPHADPVSATWPGWGSAWPLTILIISYLAYVLKFGKQYMKNRQPYSLKTTLIVYNMFQVIYNGILFCFLFEHILINQTYDFRCMETVPMDHPRKSTERTLGYLYLINKIIDLLDTIFFVLRKKDKQITFLHVFHHAFMVLGVYWTNRFYGIGGLTAVVGLLNTLVHTIMYYYYMRTALFSGLKNHLWWKKYITIIQLLQFAIGIALTGLTMIFNPGCQFPRVLKYVNLIAGSSFVYMFGKFYINTYVKPKKIQKSK